MVTCLGSSFDEAVKTFKRQRHNLQTQGMFFRSQLSRHPLITFEAINVFGRGYFSVTAYQLYLLSVKRAPRTLQLQNTG